MNSMIILSALLGLAAAVPSATVVVDDGLSGHGLGYGGLGYGGIGYAAGPAIAYGGHGVSSTYVSRVAHPSVHGGLARGWGGYGLGGYGGYGVGHGVGVVRSVVAAPAVLSAGHGLGGLGYGGYGYGVRSAGLGYGLGYGKGW